MSIDYDPFFSEHRADPYPIYAKLRRDEPVYWAERSKTWVISRYDDVMSVLKDTNRFSSDAMATVLVGMTPRRSYDGTPGAPRPSLVTSDPPVHTGLRNVLNRGFTPRQISAWKPAVEDVVKECVASMRKEKRSTWWLDSRFRCRSSSSRRCWASSRSGTPISRNGRA